MPYWSTGYRALTDSALYRHPHYHLASDTAEKVDYDRLTRVVVGLEDALRDFANVH